MATYDLNNFVIDRTIRGIMLSQADGTVQWSVNQVTNPQLTCSTETQDAVDMTGAPIATFERAKTVEFSGENALFDMALLAAQSGTTKEVATTLKKIVAPIFETIPVENPETPITLKYAPIGQIKEIFVLNNDLTLGTKYVLGDEANETQFVHTENAQEITLPTNITKGADIFVHYEYEAEEAVAVTNSASNFPKAGKFILEILGTDVCDQTTLRHAYLIMDNAKLTSDFDISFATENTHPFTIKCNQAYCSKDRKLFKLVIPNEV